jgi:hypothetical protein
MELHLSYAPVPENAAKLASVAVEALREVSGFELDYTPPSVVLVEEQIGRLVASETAVENVASTLFCLGCYLGEVIVRNSGGHWERVENSPLEGLATWPMVVVMPNKSCWNPIGKVFKRFDLGEGENLVEFYSTVVDYAARRSEKGG